MLRIKQLKIPLDEINEENKTIKEKILKKLNIREDSFLSFSIYKRSLDARRNSFGYVYTVDIFVQDEKKVFKNIKHNDDIELLTNEPEYVMPAFYVNNQKTKFRPVIVGFGPAGMFCALLLARSGLNPLIIERGKPVEKRVLDVERFWNDKILDISSNVQFGEGGAGTFSDGKLNTLVKDKYNRDRFILNEFVKAGAPEEILYDNKPHIGTDKLRCVVKNIREEIKSKGGEILFETTFTDFQINESKLTGIYITKGDTKSFIETDNVFLALGHSSRDTFTMLKNRGIPMEQKAFAVGLRIEHLQEDINKAQYKEYNGSFILDSADYKLAYHTKEGRGVYTFCMCPGGIVVAASSENGMLVTNGMSYYKRDLINANSAILVNVIPSDFPSDDILAGMHFQRDLERKAFLLGGCDWSAPVQRVEDFHCGKQTSGFGTIKPSYTGSVKYSNLKEILPSFISSALSEGIIAFDNMVKGFNNPDAVLTGVETRSSSPVRILRNGNYNSDINGIWPIGEGAGYAGGIMSAAMDGMKSAEAFIASLL